MSDALGSKTDQGEKISEFGSKTYYGMQIFILLKLLKVEFLISHSAELDI